MKKKDNILADNMPNTKIGLLPYAHHIGSALIKPIDEGKTKGVAMKAMYQQTESQLLKIKKQIENLLSEAQEIHERIDISEKIYTADIKFKPIIGHIYYVYADTSERHLLSMISPEEWGSRSPYRYIAQVELLADHTWQVLKQP